MNDIMDFLARLGADNQRTWFLEHKAEYEAARRHFERFVERLIGRVADFDPAIGGLTAGECTYRIYRDVRFSKDKSPYKTWMGAYLCRGGKKSGFSGYYLHLQPPTTGEHGCCFADGSMLALGDYQCLPAVLRTVREDIEAGGGDFARILEAAAGEGLLLDEGERLKRMPRGFDENGEWADLLKYRMYCLKRPLAAETVVDEEALLDTLTAACRAGKPFLDYLNRAIEYVSEELRNG